MNKQIKPRNIALLVHLSGPGNHGAGKHQNKKFDFNKGRTRKQKHKKSWE